MVAESNVPAIYKDGKINVWVEDAATAAYLKEVWGNDIALRFLIAGGKPSVAALSKHADENKCGNVFGIEDQDFGTSNHQDWFSPNKTFRKFTLPVLEIENLMLDAEAMEQCSVNNAGKTQEEIMQRMRSAAERQVAHMACRATISEIRRELCDNFLRHPKQNMVVDLHAAESHICDSDPAWFQRVVENRRIDRIWVRSRLTIHESKYKAALESRDWLTSFSGKEILKDAASFFYQAPKDERDQNVEKAIGSWQFNNNRVPQCLNELRDALRQRVTRKPASSTATNSDEFRIKIED